MVNKKKSPAETIPVLLPEQNKTRQTILNVLRQEELASVPVSGETLGQMLGISRVAVYKHIQGLQKEGYAIQSCRKGYRLSEPLARPFTSHEFLPEECITVVKQTGSTMDDSLRLAARNPQENFTLAALHQYSGRGRHSRQWDSPDGGLWVTRVLHPECSAINIQLHVMAATAAMARVLQQHHILDISVKWPNDVYAGRKKIAGVLGEARVSGDRINYLALGLGMNVNNTAPEGAVSYKQLCGQPADRCTLLREWISALDSLLDAQEFNTEESPDWWNHLVSSRKSVWKIRTKQGTVKGTSPGTDSLGRLILEHGTTSKKIIPAGDVLEIHVTGEKHAR